MTPPLINCPLTNTKLEEPVTGATHKNTYYIKLPSFEYEVKTSFVEDIDTKKDLGKIGHLLAGLAREILEESNGLDRLKIISDDFEKLLEDPRVPSQDDIQRKALKMLNYLKKKTSYFGEKVVIRFRYDFPVAYARNTDECISIVNFLLEQGYLKQTSDVLTQEALAPGESGRSAWILELTAEAFLLLSTGVNSKKVFVAVRFDDPKHDGFIEAIKKGVDDANFEHACLKKKESEFPERVMDKAIGEIGESKYVIIDLCGNRPSVSFEAGYALALDKELIFVAPEDEKGHREFYSGHYKISYYASEDDLREIIRDSIIARESRK